MTKHVLDEKIQAENKEQAENAAKKMLRTVIKMQDDRRMWISNRQKQNDKLDEIKAAIYTAYDNGDIEALKALAEGIAEVEQDRVSVEGQRAAARRKEGMYRGTSSYGDENA
jgi:hypothetical protein